MTVLKQIFGVLARADIEVPYDLAEEKAKADALNEEIKGLGFSTCRIAYDWCVQELETGAKTKLTSGSLVKVFKTIKDGDVEWEGNLDLSYEEKYNNGTQKGLPREKWSSMFYRGMPARLTRKDGSVIFGSLEPFCETGTEGVIWSVSEFGKSGYDALNCIKPGEHLTVYSNVRDGDVEWEGVLDFGPEKVTKLNRIEILREANHMATQNWAEMIWQRYPVVVSIT